MAVMSLIFTAIAVLGRPGDPLLPEILLLPGLVVLWVWLLKNRAALQHSRLRVRIIGGMLLVAFMLLVLQMMRPMGFTPVFSTISQPDTAATPVE